MDVFDLRQRLIQDYATYANSFITIKDHRIRERVEEDLRSGLLWPEPLIRQFSYTRLMEPSSSMSSVYRAKRWS